MRRRFPLALVLLVAAVSAVAAPVPKEMPEAMLKRVYGTVADPDSKVKCEPFGKDGARVTVPVGPSIRDNAAGVIVPLIAREVAGDFTMTVRVAQRAEEVGTGKEGQSPYLAAGVAACGADGRTSVRVVAVFVKDGDGWSPEMTLRATSADGGTSTCRATKFDPAKPVSLRLTRRGNSFVAEASDDGEKWVKVHTHETQGIGEAVTVGPVVYPNVGGEYVAEFDHYEITQPKK